jgi:hypothetical protein
MRENRTYGSEGRAAQLNASFLPLSGLLLNKWIEIHLLTPLQTTGSAVCCALWINFRCEDYSFFLKQSTPCAVFAVVRFGRIRE